MGNNSSNYGALLTKTKLEDYENIPELYRVVDPKGGGELVDVAWIAHKSGDIGKIDDYIRREVSKYLLNGGKGEMVRLGLTLVAFISDWHSVVVG